MENVYSTKSTVDIINELSLLEKELDFKVLKYNLLCTEINRRFPMLDKNPGFKKLILTTEENYVKKLK